MKPTISHLQPFGRTYYVHIFKEYRPLGSKLNPCAEKGLFFGYTDTLLIYKVHILAHQYTFTISALDIKFHQSEPDILHPELDSNTEMVDALPAYLYHFCFLNQD